MSFEGFLISVLNIQNIFFFYFAQKCEKNGRRRFFRFGQIQPTLVNASKILLKGYNLKIRLKIAN